MTNDLMFLYNFAVRLKLYNFTRASFYKHTHVFSHNFTNVSTHVRATQTCWLKMVELLSGTEILCASFTRWIPSGKAQNLNRSILTVWAKLWRNTYMCGTLNSILNTSAFNIFEVLTVKLLLASSYFSSSLSFYHLVILSLLSKIIFLTFLSN